MKTNNSFFFFLALILLNACSDIKPENKPRFLVKGNIQNASKDEIVSLQELTNSGLILIDTARVDEHGYFELKANLLEKSFFVMRLTKGDIVLVADTTGEIVLQVDENLPDNYTLKGSIENQQLKELYDINAKYMKAVQTLQLRGSSGSGVPTMQEQEAIRYAYDSLKLAHKAAIKTYVMPINDNLIPYFATNFLMPETDNEFFIDIDKKLYSHFPNSKYAIQLHNKVEALNKTAVGSVAPDLVLSDPYGKNLSLSGLRGKTVLVDFWASWCKPCRDENPKVVKLYLKYKSKGFDVFGVSLDDKRDAWIEAINKDNLLWNHGSDLLKWNSSVVNLYNIESIPYGVLVSPEGKIIAKGFTSEELALLLKERFGY